MSVVGSWLADHKIWLIKILYSFYAKLNMGMIKAIFFYESHFKWVFEKWVFSKTHLKSATTTTEEGDFKWVFKWDL